MMKKCKNKNKKREDDPFVLQYLYFLWYTFDSSAFSLKHTHAPKVNMTNEANKKKKKKTHDMPRYYIINTNRILVVHFEKKANTLKKQQCNTKNNNKPTKRLIFFQI